MAYQLYKDERRANRRKESARVLLEQVQANLVTAETELDDAGDACIFARIRLADMRRLYDDAVYGNQPRIDELKLRKARNERRLPKVNRRAREACERRNGTKVQAHARKQRARSQAIHDCRTQMQDLIREITDAKNLFLSAEEACGQAEKHFAACEEAHQQAATEYREALAAYHLASADHVKALGMLEDAQDRKRVRPQRRYDDVRLSA